MQRQPINIIPLSDDENRMIDGIVARYKRILYRMNIFQDGDTRIQINSEVRSLASDIKTMLLKPRLLLLGEIGHILQKMNNSERIYLLRNRTYVFLDCYELIAIMKGYLNEEKNRTLFACTFAEIMYRDNITVMINNIETLAATLPENERRQYTTFCLHIMDRIHSQKAHAQLKAFKKTFSSASLFAQNMLGSGHDMNDSDDDPSCTLY